MLDHIIVSASDLQRSVAFYEQALEPLGIIHYVDHNGENGHPDLKGFGSPKDKKADFWLKSGDPSPAAMHFAFVANSREQVDAFYEAAMASGARDNISPRVRLEYDPGYYAADVLDLDGYSIEVVYKNWGLADTE